MREQLLGYLLGALEEAENRQLEHRLATDTRQLRSRVAELLETDFDVRLIEKDEKHAQELSHQLKDTAILRE